LLKSVIDNLGAKLDRIIIDNLKDGTFYAKLIIKTADGKEKTVDARPSDSIALAVRAGSAIFVEDEVISKASFVTS
jgi:bifunctional DNase/RNase